MQFQGTHFMWELICHHQYSWGIVAADRSPWHSDGYAESVTPLPGQPGLRFSTPQSRIVIPRRAVDAWSVIQALRVEITASSLQGGGTVIDADGSFRVRFEGPRTLVVEILGYTFKEDLSDLPLGAWVNFQFAHDGINQLTYGFGWEAAVGTGTQAAVGGGSPINVPGQVPPVGPKGVWFGNQIGNPARHLNGNIASIKIWRLNPRTIDINFGGRPFPPPLVDCWTDFIKKIRDATAQDPECGAWVKNMVANLYSDVLKRLSQKSPDTLADFWSMLKDYQKLWKAGKVGSPEMQNLMIRLRDWLKSEGIFSSDDPNLQSMFENPCSKKIVQAIGDAGRCDADANILIKAIAGL
jgi:hypothetical protein